MQSELTRLLALEDHPLRLALVAEMHVRRFPALAAPARSLNSSCSLARKRLRRRVVLQNNSANAFFVRPPMSGRYIAAQLGVLDFIWEQHTEVGTYTFIRHGRFDDPFESPVLTEVPQDWLESLPGQVLRATQLASARPAPVRAARSRSVM